MKRIFAISLAVVAATAIVGVDLAEAKRMGGGRSFGAQRQAAPTPPAAPNVAPAAPAAPMQQAMPAKAAPAAAAPAASGASRWLGPIAGIAAGLGLVALMSHLGLSEAFGSFLLIALLVIGGVFVLRMLLARRAAGTRPSMQYAGAGVTQRVEPQFVPAPVGAVGKFEPVLGGAPVVAGVAAPVGAGRFLPGFDPAPFVLQSKRQFHKLQAAYDQGDRKALSEVMTAEMFAEISREIAERGAHTPTEVMRLDADVREVATEGDRHWATVHFSGLLREDGTVLPKEFEEIWTLSKPVDGSTGWLLAGIQQVNEAA